jgi:hypothetical protein
MRRASESKERSRRCAIVAALALASALALAAPAPARERMITVKAPAAAGPAGFDKVFVHQFGPARGRKVLVLMPGTSGGAGNFTLAARHLVKQIKGLQVWAIDRRTQAIEDTGMFKAALAGSATLRRCPQNGRREAPLPDSAVRPETDRQALRLRSSPPLG